MMNAQQQEDVHFTKEMERALNPYGSSSSTIPPRFSSPMVFGSSSLPIIDKHHITHKYVQVHCNLKPHELNVLREYMVDFTNLSANGANLIGDLNDQGWEHYFHASSGS